MSFVAYLGDDDVDDEDENPSLILHERLFSDPLPYVCYSRLRGNEMLSFIYTVVLEECATVFLRLRFALRGELYDRCVLRRFRYDFPLATEVNL